MVGRGEELDGLRSALDAAADQPTTVLLAGEAGVGKTRLVTEFAAEATEAGARVLSGNCVELGGDGVAYAPVAGAMRRLATQIGAEAVLDLAGPGRGAVTRLLPELGVTDIDPDEGRGRLFEVVTVLLERVSAEQPLVLVIEDLHWADGSTRDLLRFVIRALGSSRVVLVCTYRSDEIHRTHPLRPFLAELDRIRSVRRIDVPRLTRAEVGIQLEGILGQAAMPDAIARVHERSGGIPFFVEELASMEIDERRALPASLRDLLLVRVERLSDPTQELLRLLAVGGDRMDHAALAAVSGRDSGPLQQALREAVSTNVLSVDGDGYAFRHSLLREAIQEDLLPGERIELHRRYAETLDAHPEFASSGAAAVEVAHHWYAAQEQERAFCASLRAGDAAVTAYAHGEALLMFERALELWHRVPDPTDLSGGDHAELLSRAASAARDAGEVERSLSLLKAAVAEPGVASDPLRLGELMWQQAPLLKDAGRAIEATETVRRALEIVPADPPSVPRARLLQLKAAHLMLDGKFAEAVEVGTNAAAVARAVDACGVEFRVYTILGPALVHSGKVKSGLEALDTAHRLAGDSPRLLASHPINASDTLNLLGRYAEAAQAAIEGIDLAREVGLGRTLGAMMVGNAAEPLLALGEWERADQLITRGLELEPAKRHVWHLRLLQVWLRLWRGDVDGADQGLHEVRGVMRNGSPGPQYLLPMASITAQIALAKGDPAAAWQEVEQLLGDVREPVHHSPGHQLPVLVTGAHALGARVREEGQGAELTDAGDRIRERLDNFGDWGEVRMWRCVVEAELAGGSGDEAEPWQAVVDRVELPAHLPPYARYRLGRALVSRGDRTGAAAALTEAAAQADRLGAGLVRGWVDDLGRRAGISLGPGPSAGDSAGTSADGQPLALTGREREVLRLVADGLSNRQIGEELFISAKTASVHMSNILAKLGVSTRGEAAAIAHRQRLFVDDRVHQA